MKRNFWRGLLGLALLLLFLESMFYIFSPFITHGSLSLWGSLSRVFVLAGWFLFIFAFWVSIQSRQMDYDTKSRGTDDFIKQAKDFSRIYGFNPNIKKQRVLNSAELSKQDYLIFKTLREYARLVDYEFQLANAVRQSPAISLAFNQSILERLNAFHNARNLAESYGYNTNEDWQSYGPFKTLGT